MTQGDDCGFCSTILALGCQEDSGICDLRDQYFRTDMSMDAMYDQLYVTATPDKLTAVDTRLNVRMAQGHGPIAPPPSWVYYWRDKRQQG